MPPEPAPFDPADPAAFDRLAGPLLAVARRSLPASLAAKCDPEDVLQSALGSYLRRRAAGELRVESWEHLWAVLAGIVRNKGLDRAGWYRAGKRDVRREGPPADVPAGPTPDEEAAAREVLALAVDGFADRDRRAVALHLDGHTFDDIAGRLGCSARTARRTIDRLRARLLRLEGAA